MVENQAADTQSEKRRSLFDLLFWLALLPITLGSLFCVGQLALLVNVQGLPGNTASLLNVEYTPWTFDLIPALDLPRLLEDMARDERASGMVATPAPVITGTYWVFPTATAVPVANGTETPGFIPPTATEQPVDPPTLQPSATQNVTATRSPSMTATLQPSATLAPTQTATQTATWAPLFTATNPPQPDPPTRTPAPTRTPVPTKTIQPTFTVPPVNTRTSSPTLVPPTLKPPTSTPVTPTPTPVTPVPPTPEPEPTFDPKLVNPIAENDGVSEVVDGGCRAYFGYFNGNPIMGDIPVGALNGFNIDALTVTLEPNAQITRFEVGRKQAAFTVTWNSPAGSSFIWFLGGHNSEALWCNPPED